MKVLGLNKPIIAVVYLAPSLGKKNFKSIDHTIAQAMTDINILLEHKVDAILLENENDHPYDIYAGHETVASMSCVAYELRKQIPQEVPLGVEFLINDPYSSIAMAKASGCQFIRTDYFVDKMSREEYGGELKIAPKELIAYRDKLQAGDVEILADIQVKYATMLEDKSLRTSALQAKEHHASACIISSEKTGKAPSASCFDEIHSYQGAEEKINFPVMIGSGLSLDNLDLLYPLCDGAIVGSALMTEGRMSNQKVENFMLAVQKLRNA